MAYNPGVSDISGQLRAQGMTRGMNSLLEGFDVGIKTYQQNKHIADTSIADFGAAVSNSDELKALLADEEQRSKLPSDVVKAYLKLNKEGSLGVREASLLGGFARSFLENAKAKQQQAYQAKMMQNVDQQIAASQQAATLAQAQNAREQMAADRLQGASDRNIKAVENMRRIMDNADNLNAAVNPQFPADPINGPASFGDSTDIPRSPQAAAAVRSENAFIPYVPPALQVPNSPLRSGTTTPQAPINIFEEYRNKLGNVPVAGNMGGAGVLTVQAADRIKRRAADLEDTSLGQMIRAGITPTDEMMANSVFKDSANQIAATRATAAAENQRVKNEFENQKLELAKAGLELRDIKANDPRPLIIKYLDQEYADKNLDPEEYDYLKKRFRQYATNPTQDVQEFLAEFKALMREKTPGTPTPETKTDTSPPKPKLTGVSVKDAEKLPPNTYFTGVDKIEYFKNANGRVYMAK
jgi:hypothetical protein